MKRTLFLLFLVPRVLFGQAADSYYQSGVQLADEGKFEEAIPMFSKCIELQPENTYAWYNRGIMKAILGWHEEAIPDFEQAIQLDSLYKPARLNRGTSRKRLTDYEGAMADYNYVLRLDPNYADAHFQRGTLYQLFGKTDSACWSFQKAFDNGLERAEHKVKDCQNPSAPNQAINPILSLKKVSDRKNYGFSKKDPVKVGNGPDGGPGNQRAFLMLLRGGNGRPVEFSRSGSCCPYKSSNGFMGQGMLDMYEVTYTDEAGRKQTTTLYITFYDYEEPMIPVGFRTVGQK